MANDGRDIRNNLGIVPSAGATAGNELRYLLVDNSGIMSTNSTVSGTVAISNPPWEQYSAVGSLLAAPQDVTAAWVDIGPNPVIDTQGYSELFVYVVLDINDSTDVRIKGVALTAAAGLDEFDFPTEAVSATEVKVTSQYIEFDTDADQNMVLRFDVGAVPFIKLQVEAGAVGATAGALTSVDYNLIWR